MSEIAKILVWNMNGFSKKCDDDGVKARRVLLLEELIREHTPSIFALQEPVVDLLTRISSSIRSEYAIDALGTRRLVSGFLKSDWDRIEQPYQQKHAVMVTLKHTRVPDMITQFWNVHLAPRDGTDKQAGSVAMLCDALKNHRLKAKVNGKKHSEIVAGDFNLNPFDTLMTDKDRLNANQSAAFVRGGRTMESHENYRMFNPTWQVLGRIKPPLGTFYADDKHYVGGPWYVFDQVLLSPEHYVQDHRAQARLITKVGTTSLYGERAPTRRPNENIGSDHFPLRVRFQIG